MDRFVRITSSVFSPHTHVLIYRLYDQNKNGREKQKTENTHTETKTNQTKTKQTKTNQTKTKQTKLVPQMQKSEVY